MAFLESFIRAIATLDSEALRVVPERCVQIRNKNAQCLRCAAVCAAGAISYDGEAVTIDGERCIGCGSCATACPTCALEAVHPSDGELSDQLAQRVAAGAPVVVACARALKRARHRAEEKAEKASGLFRSAPVNFDASGVLQVVCLGRLDESFYAECAARGVREVTLGCDDCATCAYHRGGALARDVVASAESLMEAHGVPLQVTFASPLPPDTYERGGTKPLAFDPSKRAVIGTLGEMTVGAAREAAAEAIESQVDEAPATVVRVQDNGTLPQFVPVRRNRVMNSLRRLGAPQDDELCTRLWGQVSIDPARCDSCRMCAVFCPTGALERIEEEGGIALDHRAYRCVQCRLCEDICRHDAIAVSDVVSLDDFEHGRVRRIPLATPTWTPNKPDSIFTKMNALVGGDNNSYF